MKSRKTIVTLAISVVVIAGVALAFVIILQPGGSHSTGTGSSTSNLPSGCEKPANGYLIIANEEGFNDSKLHGAPTSSWPIINVTQGSTVTILVCNADNVAHGFQVNNYFDSNIESVGPGQVVKVSFVANRAGTFGIYCSILCPPHIFMQSGALRVTA